MLACFLCFPLAAVAFTDVDDPLDEAKRGSFYLDAGDYLNIPFSYPTGFLVVSSPHRYYINIGTGCQTPSSSSCTWSHSISRGIFTIGQSPGMIQVCALEAGQFSITYGTTSGELQSPTCATVVASAGSLEVTELDIPGRSMYCLLGVDRTAPLTSTTAPQAGLEVNFWFDSVRWRALYPQGPPVTVYENSSVRAAFATNQNSTQGQFPVQLSIVDGKAGEKWVLLRENVGNNPAVWTASGQLSTVAGACQGITCSGSPTDLPGRTDIWVPSDDGSGATLIIIIAVVALVVVIVVGALVLWWAFFRAKPRDKSVMAPLDSEGYGVQPN